MRKFIIKIIHPNILKVLLVLLGITILLTPLADNIGQAITAGAMITIVIIVMAYGIILGYEGVEKYTEWYNNFINKNNKKLNKKQ